MQRIRTHLALVTTAVAAAVALLAIALPATAAEHQVTVRDSSFQPRNLTIQVGDTVTWTNTGFLAHNVRANDASFRCANGCDHQGGDGGLSSASWSFSLTFDDPGTIGYFCQAHGTIGGGGMAGTLTVEGAADEFGSLQLSNGSASVTEGGTAVFTVQRVGGDDGAVSVAYSTG
ncbi:MAG TPA: plastocyanin/azurin family copper-binding protein, partial [Thermoanaerobaculia bacterium]|nr:plastocyanin/azurin family copper-binding protein [Thermoanaerobaculia bacterium]